MDLSDAMKDFVEEHTVNNCPLTDIPDKIWNHRVDHFHASVGNFFTGMTKSQDLWCKMLVNTVLE